MWPEPAPGAPGAVPADPGMDSEGWFAVNGWKYLVKWHHSGSYQLYPGKVPRGLRALSWLAGAGWLAPSAGTCAACALSPAARPGAVAGSSRARGCGSGEMFWGDDGGLKPRVQNYR